MFRLFSLPTVGSILSDMQFLVGTFLPHKQRSIISEVKTTINFEYTKSEFVSAAMEPIDSEFCGESTRFRISIEFAGFVKKYVQLRIRFPDSFSFPSTEKLILHDFTSQFSPDAYEPTPNI